MSDPASGDELVALVPVSPANYELARALHVRPDQQRLVGSVQRSLADAYVHEAAEFRLGWVGNEPVGYVLIFAYEQAGRRLVNIVRLMIDARFQGRGLGRGLLRSTLEWIRTRVPPAERIRIATLPDNAIALALYESAGFVRAGIENGEVALYMDLHTPRLGGGS